MGEAVDLAVAGSGPAGVSAAIQAVRDGLSVVLCGDEPVGGLVRAARRLDNLPGWPDGIRGAEFADALESQLRGLGIQPRIARVAHLRKVDGAFELEADGGTAKCRAIVIATGTRPAGFHLPIPGGPEKNIHRDARTLPSASELAGKSVIVIGGGEAALDAALTCSDRGAKVTVFARGSFLKAPQRLIREAVSAGISIRTGVQARDIVCGEGIRVRFEPAGTFDGPVDHLIISTGREPRLELYHEVCGSRDIPRSVTTSVPGLFLAGDVINGTDRFAASAIGDGQRAARLALRFLQREEYHGHL